MSRRNMKSAVTRANSSRNRTEDEIYRYLIWASVIVFALSAIMWFLNVISFWRASGIVIVVIAINVLFNILTDDEFDAGRLIGGVIGFGVGLLLVVTISPITTPIGIGIIAFTAYRLGWLGESTAGKLGGGK
ncbi:hypothetical protein [uncultured Methanolobus sp.]|uniref:hypothetical protein n=1 Tax=uncultured Methanolobus sp. TaxID=218300 RepID=UPI002AAA9E2F|nr:hypothetical protein [uncultured Methanolobus sp.]